MKRLMFMVLAGAAMVASIVRPSLSLQSPDSKSGQPRRLATISGTVTVEGTKEPLEDVEIRVSVITPELSALLTAPIARSRPDAAQLLAAGAPFVFFQDKIVLSIRGSDSVFDLNDPAQARSILGLANTENKVPAEIVQYARNTVDSIGAGVGARTFVPSFAVLTDSDGRFTINVPPGKATINASKPGYFGPPMHGGFTNGVRKEAKVTIDEPLNVQFSFWPGGSIAGRVLGPSGKPAMSTQVELLRPVYDQGYFLLEHVQLGRTDDRGDYRFFAIIPGEYYVSFMPNIVSLGSNSPVQRPVRFLYPGVTDVPSARAVRLASGQDVTGIDVRMRSVPGVHVSGRVISALVAGNVRAQKVDVEMARVDRSIRNTALSRLEFPSATVELGGGDGGFTLDGVVPGRYLLTAWISEPRPPLNPDPRPSPLLAFGRSIVDVGEGDVSGVTVVVSPPVDIKGKVIVDGFPRAVRVRISLESDEGSLSRLNPGSIGYPGGGYRAQVAGDGSFSFAAIPPGHYRFKVTTVFLSTPGSTATEDGFPSLAAGAAVADIVQAGTSVYDNGIDIDQSIDAVDIRILTNNGRIVGTVDGFDPDTFDPDNRSGATVVLVPPVNRRQNPALYLTAGTNEKGQFSLNGVPPGEYKAFASTTAAVDAFQNADFLSRVEPQGTAITVAAGMATSVEIRVIKEER